MTLPTPPGDKAWVSSLVPACSQAPGLFAPTLLDGSLPWLFKQRKGLPAGYRRQVGEKLLPQILHRFQKSRHMYGLLTKCEVKMAGYWSSPFPFFACLWTETKSRSINSQKKKKERGQYPAILSEQTWSIKDVLFDFRGNFSCWLGLDTAVVPSGQDGSILPARVANHIVRFGSSCPLAELAI